MSADERFWQDTAEVAILAADEMKARLEAASEAVVFKAAEWMNFHEVAIADPFAAEREVIAFCRSLAAVLRPPTPEGGATDGS